MVMFEEYTAVMAGLQFICRTARRLSKLPDNQLVVSEEDAVDAEYMNECLGIVLRMLDVRIEDTVPLDEESHDVVQIYFRCMKLAYRWARQLLWRLRFRLIKKDMVTHEVWYNVDTAEAFVRELSFCRRKGGKM